MPLKNTMRWRCGWQRTRFPSEDTLVITAEHVVVTRKTKREAELHYHD